MLSLQAIRRKHWLTQWVTMVFVLALQVAALAPVAAWAQAQSEQWAWGQICSAQPVADSTHAPALPDTQAGQHHTLQCVLCLPAMAMPVPEMVWGLSHGKPVAPQQVAQLAHPQLDRARPSARGPPL